MRAIVIDWLVEVAEEWKLCSGKQALAVQVHWQLLVVGRWQVVGD